MGLKPSPKGLRVEHFERQRYGCPKNNSFTINLTVLVLHHVILWWNTASTVHVVCYCVCYHVNVCYWSKKRLKKRYLNLLVFRNQYYRQYLGRPVPVSIPVLESVIVSIAQQGPRKIESGICAPPKGDDHTPIHPEQK